MSALTSRRQASPRALSDSDKLEPVEPAYYKPVSASPVSAHMRVPSEATSWKAPVVMRGQRRVGMRYLLAMGAVRQNISPLGTGPDLGMAVWSSAFEQDQSSTHDAGFNDALYQAGYPGFNLGLSFKVQQVQRNGTNNSGPGYGLQMRSPNVRVTVSRIARMQRAQSGG